ncbi:hypothetical protein [Pantoea sp. Lij88]|uniref:hypothetical protein n=1 Tax=Pantoea sp. Lij88 TaxID=3028622 RepID=UPI0024B96BF9|nr:hypothetical protein [Pantoea sp. Lij88]WHQ74409.1 hypothetical protein PU624_16535 [Pantoea sp. Lij88]
MLVSTNLNCTPERVDRLGTIDGQLFLPEENGLFDREVNALRYLVESSSPGFNIWCTNAYSLTRFPGWLERQQIACRALDRTVLRHDYIQRRFSQKRRVAVRT